MLSQISENHMSKQLLYIFFAVLCVYFVLLVFPLPWNDRLLFKTLIVIASATIFGALINALISFFCLKVLRRSISVWYRVLIISFIFCIAIGGLYILKIYIRGELKKMCFQDCEVSNTQHQFKDRENL